MPLNSWVPNFCGKVGRPHAPYFCRQYVVSDDRFPQYANACIGDPGNIQSPTVAVRGPLPALSGVRASVVNDVNLHGFAYDLLLHTYQEVATSFETNQARIRDSRGSELCIVVQL